MFLPMFLPVGVAARFRLVFAENTVLRPYGQQPLKLFCSWDRKLGTHVFVVFCLVSLGMPQKERITETNIEVPIEIYTEI